MCNNDEEEECVVGDDRTGVMIVAVVRETTEFLNLPRTDLFKEMEKKVQCATHANLCLFPHTLNPSDSLVGSSVHDMYNCAIPPHHSLKQNDHVMQAFYVRDKKKRRRVMHMCRTTLGCTIVILLPRGLGLDESQ